MADLLSIFVVAALLENFVLALFFDRIVDPAARRPWELFAVAAAAWILATLLPRLPVAGPPQLQAFLAGLGFVACAMTVARCDTQGIRLRARAGDVRTRGLMPLAVANAAVLALAVFDRHRPHPAAETLAFCAAASLGFQALASALPALDGRLEASAVPLALKGLPITLLTAAMVSLAAMGIPALWP
jgi:Na+-translocating ferredoxin:NAD+ oxidoreductase RnfA subunit